MLKFDVSFTKPETFRSTERKPMFDNLKKVLEKKKPDRPTLFEFFLNMNLHNLMADQDVNFGNDNMAQVRKRISAYKNLGYDYITYVIPGFGFPNGRRGREGASSISLNEGSVITDWESFNKYKWIEPDDADYDFLDRVQKEMPDGMKLIVHGPCGVLENVIKLTGYDNLCFMLADDPDLAFKVFENVGSRLVKYYELSASHNVVGALISNDDWGFNTQTMLSIENMREYVIPWHKKIVETIHKVGKPVILHSCGCLDRVMDDIIFDIGYDAKHSYEDKIMPVEKAYEELAPKIAVLGGIDVDFVCRSTPEKVFERSLKMLNKSFDRYGLYALGTGNSVPTYVPIENYLAMVAAVKFNN